MARTTIDSPIGPVTIETNGEAITRIEVDSTRKTDDEVSPILQQAVREMTEYVTGKRTSFDLPMQPKGTTFEKAIWNAMAKIPYGKTVSYADLAASVGKPDASRAVANACGKNPLLILIPCHRIIASDGTLGGFSAGIAKKKWLLEHEKS